MIEGKIGKEVVINRPLDKWVPEAEGSTARVFEANINSVSHALKIMNAAWILYSLPRFLEEVIIMTHIGEIEWATHLLEFGFIRLENIPTVNIQDGRWNVEASQLKGDIFRNSNSNHGHFSSRDPDILQFITRLQDYYERIQSYFEKNQIERDSELSHEQWKQVYKLIDGYLPYLSFERRATFVPNPIKDRDNLWAERLADWKRLNDRKETNLVLLCDPTYALENRLSPVRGLEIAIQICDILIAAHELNVAFKDHKILHYYWNKSLQHVFVIDWNMGQYFTEGITTSEKVFDTQQFSARALCHILTGQQAIGALDVGRTEYRQLEEAKQNPSTYRPPWKTQEDRKSEERRLGKELVELLEYGLNPGFDSPELLRNQLQGILKDPKG